jgi:hypothetical protein
MERGWWVRAGSFSITMERKRTAARAEAKVVARCWSPAHMMITTSGDAGAMGVPGGGDAGSCM